MWPATFEARLGAWTRMRQAAGDQPQEQCLSTINTWWFGTPWAPYHLHWDDQPSWPDPWQLLEDNIYCSIARGLGIMYTISMLERPDLTAARMIEVGADNLVTIPGEKYILNWDRNQIVNINLVLEPQGHSLDQQQITQLIR